MTELINKIPDGYSEAIYNNSRYSINKRSFNNGKSFKIYAKELKGKDFISLNFYITNNKKIIKPCEMTLEKVLAFLKGIVIAK